MFDIHVQSERTSMTADNLEERVSIIRASTIIDKTVNSTAMAEHYASIMVNPCV